MIWWQAFLGILTLFVVFGAMIIEWFQAKKAVKRSQLVRAKENDMRRICGNCLRGAGHPFWPKSKVICLAGKGVRRTVWFACELFDYIGITVDTLEKESEQGGD